MITKKTIKEIEQLILKTCIKFYNKKITRYEATNNFDSAKKELGKIIKTDRSVKHHKTLFACVNTALQNTDLKCGSYFFIKHIMKEYGITEKANINGKSVIQPKSISFNNMSQNEFWEVFNPVVDYCSMILQVTPKQLLESIIANGGDELLCQKHKKYQT